MNKLLILKRNLCDKEVVLLSLVLNFLFLLISFLLHPKYQTNDDISQIFIYSKKIKYDLNINYTGFSTKLYGIIVSNLYSLFVNVEIYTILLFIVNFLSWFLIFKLLIKKIKEIDIKTFLLLFMVGMLFVIPSYSELQFTVIACLCSISGIIGYEFSKSRFKILNLIFLVIGLAIRPDTFFYIVILYTILSSHRAFSNFYVFKFFLKRVFLIIFLGISFLSIDNSLLTKAEIKFREFNNYKVSLLDYNLSKNNKYAQKTYPLFLNWYFAESCVNGENIDYSSDNFKFNTREFLNIKKVKNNINKLNPFLHNLLLSSKFSLTIYFVLLILVIYNIGNYFKNFITMLIIILFLIIISILFKEVPFRLIFPTFLFYFIYIILTEKLKSSPPLVNLKYHNWVIISLFMLCVYSFAYFNFNRLFWKYHDLLELQNLDNRAISVISPYYNYENSNPFNVPNLNNKKIVLLGTYSYFNNTIYASPNSMNVPFIFLELEGDYFVEDLIIHLEKYHKIESEVVLLFNQNGIKYRKVIFHNTFTD